MKISDFLDRFSDNILAKEEGGEYIKYSAPIDLCESLNQFFTEKKLVFQITSNAIGSLVGYIAFNKLNSANFLISDQIFPEYLANLLDTYRPNYIWAPKEFCEKNLSPYPILYEYANYCFLSFSGAKLNIDDEISLLLSTSGSTGTAKLVKLSDYNLVSNAESIAEYLNIDCEERPITTLPMNYSYGLSIINSHIIKGATILLTKRSILEPEFWSFFRSEGATSFGGVPYTYEMLHRIRFGRMNLPSLRYITQAGGRLSDDLVSKFYDISVNKDIRFYVMYGQTEATARISYVPPILLSQKIGSVGIAIPQGELNLIDAKGNIIEDFGVEGELVYRGPNVFGGYAQNLSDLSSLEKIEWLHTGDLAQKDNDGFFYITGRKKRFVKLYGNRISLDMVEKILKRHIQNVAVVGTDDLVKIFIADAEIDFNIPEFLSEQLHFPTNIFEVNEVKEIPVNDSGKVLYSKLC